MSTTTDNNLSKDSLGDRMKRYEYFETERYFIPRLPLYARIDGRAFHTFTRGLPKPFPGSKNEGWFFVDIMKEVCKGLVEETGANIGYVQSDEISLGWVDLASAPFEGRIFKLTSVLASIAGSLFTRACYKSGCELIKQKVDKIIPSFDCRVCQLPDLSELANMFVWRENDAIKNSVSSYANELFSTKELEGKNKVERMKMLADVGHDWNELDLNIQRGTYFAHVLEPKVNENGEQFFRSPVKECFYHHKLSDVENKVGYLFNCEEMKLKLPLDCDKECTSIEDCICDHMLDKIQGLN